LFAEARVPIDGYYASARNARSWSGSRTPMRWLRASVLSGARPVALRARAAAARARARGRGRDRRAPARRRVRPHGRRARGVSTRQIGSGGASPSSRKHSKCSGSRWLKAATAETSPPCSASARARYPYFVSLLRDLGFRARLHVTPQPADYFAEITRPGSRKQMGVCGWAPDYMSASTVLAPMFACPARGDTRVLNVSHVCSARLDAASAGHVRPPRRTLRRRGQPWIAASSTSRRPCPTSTPASRSSSR